MANDKGVTASDLGMTNLEWLQMVEQVDAIPNEEGFKEKFIRRTRDNPYVPCGILATVVALSFGLVNLKKGNSQASQFWMRARVIAQGFTVTAIVIGLGITAMKSKNVATASSKE